MTASRRLLSDSVWTVVTVLALHVGMAGAQGIPIELRASAELVTPRYTLGEIATLPADAGSQRQRLMALVIGEAPRFGYTARLDRASIEERVAKLVPALRNRLQWSGAQAITLRGKGQKVDAGQLIDTAAAELGQLHGTRYQALEIRPVGEAEDLFVPQGQVSLVARRAPADGLSKRTCVWVAVHLDGRPYRTVPVWFDVKALAKVLIAKFPRAPGEPMRKSDFGVGTVDVAAYASAPLPADDRAFDSLRLRQPLSAGAPLLRAHVEQRPAVARNDNVNVTIQQGAIVIESTGVALADAQVGEVVKVRNPRSNEMFSATVVAAGTVTIDAR